MGITPLWVPNMIGCALASAYMMIFLWFCPAKADWLPSSRITHIIGVLSAASFVGAVLSFFEQSKAAQILGLTGNILAMIMFGGPLAAVRTCIEERSTRSLSFGFTLLTVVNCTLWLIYGVILRDVLLVAPNVPAILSGVVQLALFARFGLSS
jgi:solute carrier family 50 protein (sugar transporter)